MKGNFITFEGSEGSGKSTQIKFVYQYLRKKKKSVLLLREPGGVKISEKIRNILLDLQNKHMCDECETLLYMAARAQLVEEVIIPALKNGKNVLCDRFLDSTVAYQGYGSGVDIGLIKRIGKFATQGIVPDLTFVFDISSREGLSRISGMRDRIESRSIRYHNRVRQGYLDLARQYSRRVRIISGDKDKESIRAVVRGYIDRLFNMIS